MPSAAPKASFKIPAQKKIQGHTTTPSTMPSAAPKASFKIPAQKKFRGADKKKWNQGSVTQSVKGAPGGRTTPSPA